MTYRLAAPKQAASSGLSVEQSATGSGNVQAVVNGSGNNITIGAPPVTDQQKSQAIESLKGELENLAEFPNRPIDRGGRNHIEQIFVRTDYIHLYEILSKYYGTTISSAPDGERLINFKRSFYDFEDETRSFEQYALIEIGKVVQVRFMHGWDIYLYYFELRALGYTPDRIQNEGGSFLNYGITWNDAERVYGLLSKNPDIGPVMVRLATNAAQLQEDTSAILTAYKTRQR